MLTEQKFIDKIEIIYTGTIQVRQVTVIEKDGVEIARTYHRWSFNKGDDISEMPETVKQIANIIWA